MTGAEIIAIVGAVASAASAVGTVMSMNQRGAVADYNTQVAQGEADAARDAAKTEADDIRRRGAKEQSKLRAAAGAAGLIAEEGSPYELLLENAQEIELDAQRRLFRGDTEARRYESQGRLDQAGKPGMGSYLSAGAGLLEGGAKAWAILDKGASGGAGASYSYPTVAATKVDSGAG